MYNKWDEVRLKQVCTQNYMTMGLESVGSLRISIFEGGQ